MSVLVLRNEDKEKLLEFFQGLGLQFVIEKHGDGPEHYACEYNGYVLELYPRRKNSDEDEVYFVHNNFKNALLVRFFVWTDKWYSTTELETFGFAGSWGYIGRTFYFENEDDLALLRLSIDNPLVTTNIPPRVIDIGMLQYYSLKTMEKVP